MFWKWILQQSDITRNIWERNIAIIWYCQEYFWTNCSNNLILPGYPVWPAQWHIQVLASVAFSGKENHCLVNLFILIEIITIGHGMFRHVSQVSLKLQGVPETVCFCICLFMLIKKGFQNQNDLLWYFRGWKVLSDKSTDWWNWLNTRS